jgi:hypothetical protein
MDDLARRLLNAILGTALDPVKSEADHFYTCQQCGQAVDYRKLGDVLHHEDEGHKPIPTN